jgi:hypothetical protein
MQLTFQELVDAAKRAKLPVVGGGSGQVYKMPSGTHEVPRKRLARGRVAE